MTSGILSNPPDILREEADLVLNKQKKGEGDSALLRRRWFLWGDDVGKKESN